MDTTATTTDELDVLIVDDDPQIAALVEAVLRHHEAQNFTVRRAVSASEGLAAYDQRPADVVVLDLGLPDAHRADPLRILRDLLSRHPLPCVVVLTAHPWGLGREAVRMGAQDYLDKGSMTAAHLRDTVLFAIERHAHTTRNASIEALATADRAATHPTQRGGAERLRTPLGTLTRSLEALRNGGDLARKDQLALLDQALRGAYALGGQLDQVVAAQRRLVVREPVDLDDVTTRVVEDLADLAEIVGASVEVGPLPRLWGQPEPLHLMMRNLVLNALQHGGSGVAIQVSSQQHPLGLRLLVDDSGPGIASEDRAALFDGPGAAAHGFGLRACAAVASAHGGRCWVEDSPLGGTRVVVELPVRRRVAP